MYFVAEACGLEFRSDRLWESYIKWEAENGSALNVTNIYDRLLATPTLGYTSHFDKFVQCPLLMLHSSGKQGLLMFWYNFIFISLFNEYAVNALLLYNVRNNRYEISAMFIVFFSVPTFQFQNERLCKVFARLSNEQVTL